MVTFDEAETGSPEAATACCGEVPGPNSPLPGINGPGGGRVGAVLVSPFVAPGTVNDTPYNHYALLRTVEDVFGLDHLGFAGADGLASFGPDVFAAPTAPASSTTTTSRATTASDPAASSVVPRGGGGRLPVTGAGVPVPVLLALAVVAVGAVTIRWRLGR